MKLEDFYPTAFSFEVKLANGLMKRFKLSLISSAIDNHYKLNWDFNDINLTLKVILEICVELFEREDLRAAYISIPYYASETDSESFTIGKTEDNLLSDYYEPAASKFVLKSKTK